MRLSKQEISLLKNELKILDLDAKIYLFGSRVDDSKKGGDIDLLVISTKLKKKDLRRLRIEFFKEFGEQKMDIVLDDGSLENSFVNIIFEKAVLL